MFKIGQRVIFVDCQLPRHPLVIYPKIHEVVTVDAIALDNIGRLFILLKEYPNPIMGQFNGILAICFRPIDKSFAEETLRRIAEEIEEEELVSIK